MIYPLLLVFHLVCAILFIGVVFFEVVLLEGVRKHLADDRLMDRFEAALVQRARRIMPYVVGVLFVTGIALFIHHFDALDFGWHNAFAVLLGVKILLATSVLVHFVTAIRAQAHGCMSTRRFQITHFSVAAHMLLIVILAKTMFYVSW